MGVLMRSLKEAGNGIFHVFHVTSILRIQRSESQVTAQHGDTVHHVQIGIRLRQLCGFFEKVFRRNSAHTHASVRATDSPSTMASRYRACAPRSPRTGMELSYNFRSIVKNP